MSKVRPSSRGAGAKKSKGGLGASVENRLLGSAFPFDEVSEELPGVWPPSQQAYDSVYSRVIFFLSAGETIVMLVGFILAFVLAVTEQDFKVGLYNWYANFEHKSDHDKHSISAARAHVGPNHVAYLLASVLTIHFVISLMKLVCFKRYRAGLIGGLSWPRAITSIPLVLLTFAFVNLLGNVDVSSSLAIGLLAGAPLIFGCFIESFLLISTRISALRAMKLRKAGEGYQILGGGEVTSDDRVTNRVAGFFSVAMPWILQIVHYLALSGIVAGYFFTAVEKSDAGVPGFLWVAFILYVAGQALAGIATSIFYLNWYLSGSIPFFKNSFWPEVAATVFNWLVFVGVTFSLLGGLYHNY